MTTCSCRSVFAWRDNQWIQLTGTVVSYKRYIYIYCWKSIQATGDVQLLGLGPFNFYTMRIAVVGRVVSLLRSMRSIFDTVLFNREDVVIWCKGFDSRERSGRSPSRVYKIYSWTLFNSQFTSFYTATKDIDKHIQRFQDPVHNKKPKRWLTRKPILTTLRVGLIFLIKLLKV